jgi:hypothetical protein
MVAVASQFYAGRYSEIVAEFVDSAAPKEITGFSSVYVIGALSFLSRTSEAESLFSIYRRQMSDRERFEAKYYLVTALRRERRRPSSAKARAMLGTMIQEMRRLGAADDHMEFFLCCGLAFYRYIDGRFPLALKWAQKAYDHAFRANFPFGRLVAYDLIGHSQLIVGQVRAGLKNLSSSAMIADSLGRGAIRQAVDVASRLYRSTYGLASGRELLDDLNGAIKACAFENSYTLASLYIELARLQILTGDGHKAEASLRDASEGVYRLDIPFLDANLTFRYAHLATLQGDLVKALELIRTARSRATDANSASLMVSILGLENRILRMAGREDEAMTLEPQIRGLAEKSGQIISQRINARIGIASTNDRKRGEDILGDLLDDVKLNVKDARTKILQAGFLGLSPNIIELPPFSEAIIFGFESDSVTLLHKGQVRHDRDGWPELVRKLIFALSEKRKLTKEEIADKVWRQPYSPIRHDPLIYALIARTRKTLEPFEEWLTVLDGTYCLRESVIVQDVTVMNTRTAPLQIAATEAAVQSYPDLSFRQAKIMDLCATHGSVTNKSVCEAFQVSEVTAGRDLSDLSDKGYLKKVGKGRATTYTKS